MPFGKLHFLRFALVLILISLFAGLLMAQQPAPRQRILQSIDNTRLTKLSGNTHPLARAEYDRGRAPDSLAADRILLLLSRTPEQEAALAQLLDDQQTVGSANYRRWLTPEEFGQQFGAADADIQTITAWLQTQGFQINSVSASKNLIEFSGTAGQVRNSFHTELHKYAVGGKEYWANAADPHIPTALLPVVKGLVSLNNFPHKPQYRKLGALPRNAQGKPEMTGTINGTTFYGVGPADFATIYKTSSLLSAGTTGSGQTIAIIGDSNIDLQDVTDFRSFFSLTGGSASVVVDGTDPGIVPGDSVEALLDVQWSGAVAPGANVKLVTAQQTTTTAGIFLAANYAIQQNIGGILSLSFGSCEPYLGTAGNQYVQALWQQASAQGITVLVSTGDEGSAGCDYHAYSDIAQNGLAVNGFASTPYNIAVGGTDFDDANSFATYWNATNNAAYGSAKSYIPEKTWNETCAATATANNLAVCPTWNGTGTPPAGISVVAGSGGASNCSTSTSDVYGNVTCQSGTPKPQWQSGTGVLNDGVRDIPDVSLFAAAWDTDSKSSYVIMESGDLYTIGGTSASAPSFAGIVALFNQKANTRLGNLNYLLYSIAANAGSSCSSSGSEAASCVFNDVTKGNISVPCVAGTNNCSVTSGTATGVLIDNSRKPAFTTTSGYDLATGLGSVNAANLATAILTAKGKFTPTTTALTLNSGTSTVTAKHGDPISVGVNVTPTTATGPIAVQNSNGQGIDNATLVSGSSTWYSSLFPGGNYTVTAHYPGDGSRAASDSNGVQVNISPEDSKTFLEVMSWDDSGNFHGYENQFLAYGSNYLVRVDVGDASAILSSAGVNSKCWNGTASCPTGTVALTQNGAPLDAGSYKLNSAGHAEDQTIQLLPGTYALAASYPGDTSYNASSATANLTVTKAPVNISFTPSSGSIPYGSSNSFNVTVAATANGVAPTGNIEMLDNGSAQNSAGTYPLYSSYPQTASHPAYSNGSAYLNALPVGNHSISVQYFGDSLYNPAVSSASNIQVVKATPGYTALSAIPNPTSTQLPVNIQFYLSGSGAAPTGTVTILDNGTPINAGVTYRSSANNTFINATYTFAQAGTHVLTFNYDGDANYNGVTGAQLGTVTAYTQVPTSMNPPYASASPVQPNQPVTFEAFVLTGGGPNPTGTVTFYSNGVALTDSVTYPGCYQGCLLATVTHTFATSAAYNITASYSGDNNTAPVSSGPLAFTVVDKIPTVAQIYGVSPYPNVVNQPSSINLNASGQVNGNGSWPAMTGTFTVTDAGTALSGNLTLGQSNSTFLNGSLQYTFTTVGTHSLVVQYSGDSNYAASQSQPFSVDIVGVLSIYAPTGSDYSMPSHGGTGTTSLNVSNNGASSETATFTCTSDSTAATCSLSPASLTMPGNTTWITTLTYTVPSLSAAAKHPTAPWHGKGGLLLGAAFACCVLAARKRKHLLLIAGVLALTFGMLSCGGGGSSSGGGGNPPPPTSKTYHFTVKATDGTNTATQVITVTVGS